MFLAQLATGDPWNLLIPGNFGFGLVRRSDDFECFVNHFFVRFYHKISSSSLVMWISNMVEFW